LYCVTSDGGVGMLMAASNLACRSCVLNSFSRIAFWHLLGVHSCHLGDQQSTVPALSCLAGQVRFETAVALTVAVALLQLQRCNMNVE
jgi:hypothetical protein